MNKISKDDTNSQSISFNSCLISSLLHCGHPLDANCGGSQSTEVGAEAELVAWVVAEAVSALPSFGRIERDISREVPRDRRRSAVLSAILESTGRKERKVEERVCVCDDNTHAYRWNLGGSVG